MSKALVLVLGLAASLAAQVLRVKETAGIRRFSYPVTVKLPAAGTFRLLDRGKPVPAQCRGDELDFNASLGPNEQREYQLEAAPAGPAPSVVKEEGGRFVVGYGPSLEFAVPRDLLGLLASVRTPRWDYLRPGSQGLLLRYREDMLFRVGGFGPWGTPTQARLVKQGPLATTLEFSSTEALRSSRSVASRVRMEFPRSKSWVKTTWTVEDPEAFLIGLGVDLNLNIQGAPALVDFGAGSMVYAALRARQEAALIGGPQSWQVLLGPDPYATGQAGPAEGWAHVMDRERCTAIAVAGFGERQDRIEATSSGRLQIWREARGSGPKTLTFWLHFVSMPVQVGAATSPQAMLAPLKTEWLWNRNN